MHGFAAPFEAPSQRQKLFAFVIGPLREIQFVLGSRHREVAPHHSTQRDRAKQFQRGAALAPLRPKPGGLPHSGSWPARTHNGDGAEISKSPTRYRTERILFNGVSP